MIIAVQVLNGWVQGMGWPPCGKSMVHWFSTRERALTVSVWNTAHNVGGGLVATLALLGVTLFGDWRAKFYFNALIAAIVAVGVYFLLQDTPQSRGLPPIEEYKNDYPPDYTQASERTSASARSLSATCCPTAICGPSPPPTCSATSCATAWRTGFRPTCSSPRGIRSRIRAWGGRCTSLRPFPAPSPAAGYRTVGSGAGARRRRCCS